MLFDHLAGGVDLESFSVFLFLFVFLVFGLLLLEYFLLLFLGDLRVLVLLEADLCTEVLQVLMGLFEDGHYARILLRVDQIDIGVDVILFEKLYASTFLLVNHVFR